MTGIDYRLDYKNITEILKVSIEMAEDLETEAFQPAELGVSEETVLRFKRPSATALCQCLLYDKKPKF